MLRVKATPSARAGQGADDADACARQHEDAQDHAARGAHRAQDRDVAALVLDHHDHARNDVESGDDDDQGQDQEHDVALDLDCVEEARIGLLPVDDAHPPAECGIDQPRLPLHPVGIGDKDLEVGHRARQLKEQLRRRERGIDKAVVVLVHADIEQRHDVIGLDPRHRAKDGGGALRRDHRNPAADADAELLRQPPADGDAVIVELGQRSGDDPVRNQAQGAQIRRPDAVHQGARGAGVGGRHDLAFDDRDRRGDARNPPHLLRRGGEIAERARLRVHAEIAVQTEDAAHQVGAEAVHYRHDDDQGGHTEGDPEQRKDRDDRDEPLRPPRPQIAERHHPLEGIEDHGRSASASGLIASSTSSVYSITPSQ